MKSYDVIIAGAGAAGLMCALTAGQRGRKVLLVERANKPGKKILMSGGGRCNFTNLHIAPDRFLSDNPYFCISALNRYTQWDFIELVEKHKIAWHEKTRGQLFCNNSSKEILAMLLHECERAGVTIKINADIESVNIGTNFIIRVNRKTYTAESFVVATGGLSIPKMGGSGYGYDLARQFELNVLPTRAGLVPFVITDRFQEITSHLSGVSLPVGIKTGRQEFVDDLLFTHRGLSGPAALQISNYWQEGEILEIDLLPDLIIKDVLLSARQMRPKILLRTLLSDYLPRKLVQSIESLWWKEAAEKPLAEWQNRQLLAVSDYIHDWKIKPAGTEGYRTAEVTLGGVDTRDLSSKTMECKHCPGLYIIGEVVDVTGHLGGFNFQWAWSSGHIAGQYV